MTKLIKEFEIVNHGIDNSSYFQGCGSAFTSFEECVTGIGSDLNEAFEDALECIAQQGYDPISIESALAGLEDHGAASGQSDDVHYYLSIRFK